MSIASEISRLMGDSLAIAQAIEAKGVTVPQGSGFDDYASLISQISGGGGEPLYTPVEYIEFSGTQYICSWIVPTQATNYDITVMPTGSGAYKSVISSRYATNSRRFELMFGTPNAAESQIYYGYNNGSTTVYNGSSLTNHLLRFVKSGNNLKTYDSGTQITNNNATAASFTAPLPLVIGASNTNGTINNYFIGRIYEITIGGVTFRPVRINGVGALLDTSSGAILYNSGTGTISYGPDLTTV